MASQLAVGGRVEVTQIGDVTLKEQTDLVLVEEDGNVSLLENKTTIAEVPQEDGTTAVLANVQRTVRATGDQQVEQDQDLPATRRIPDNPRRAHPTTTTTPTTTPTTAPPPAPAPPPPATAPATAATRRPAAAVSINATHTDQHRTRQQQPRPAQRRHNNINYGGGGGGVQREYFVRRGNPWRRCQHCFYILWMVLLTFFGLVGLGYVGLGVWTHRCQEKEPEVGIFELWTSSFVTGAIMVSFTLCVWLSCGAYFICCRKRKALCIGVVTGCGIIAGFLFIIAFSYNASAVGLTVDASPGINGTLHDTDCFTSHYYWVAYVSPFASGAVLLALLASLCCYVFCNGCFYIFCDLSDNQYDRLLN